MAENTVYIPVRPGRPSVWNDGIKARVLELRREGLPWRRVAEGVPVSERTILRHLDEKEKGPGPTNGHEANERIPGERLELSPYENSTSPATPSATAEERA